MLRVCFRCRGFLGSLCRLGCFWLVERNDRKKKKWPRGRIIKTKNAVWLTGGSSRGCRIDACLVKFICGSKVGAYVTSIVVLLMCLPQDLTIAGPMRGARSISSCHVFARLRLP